MRGPFSQNVAPNLTEYVARSWYCTDKGVVKRHPLPYSSTRITCTNRYQTANYSRVSGPWDVMTSTNFNPKGSDLFRTKRGSVPSEAILAQRAYQKFIGKFKEDAMMLVNLAEYRQAYNMALSVVKALRSPMRVIGSAMKQLASSNTPKGAVKTLSETGNLWLAWHFGAMPLFQDLHACYKILTSELPAMEVFAQQKGGGENYDSFLSGLNVKIVETVKAAVKYHAWVECSNPNLFLANQLGLLNPASVAWELVPWSFLVDWFIPIGPYLSSLTDFVGLTLRDPYCTRFISATGYSEHGANYNGKFEYERVYYRGAIWSRTLGITYSPPKMVRVPNMGPSRIATAWALAFQPVASAVQRTPHGLPLKKISGWPSRAATL